LRKLTDEHGISILYITHDLATAYQVSDAILVLYRARLVEAGAVERVVRAPQHPYTQLLVAAVPRARQARDWIEEGYEAPHNGGGMISDGCPFADRCAHATSLCAAAPPLYRTEVRRVVACVLYREYPTLAAQELGRWLSI
jgi:oligopeptide/dipeptide ABC transporter ATP-binding protein